MERFETQVFGFYGAVWAWNWISLVLCDFIASGLVTLVTGRVF
jgi:hypothetical protein